MTILDEILQEKRREVLSMLAEQDRVTRNSSVASIFIQQVI